MPCLPHSARDPTQRQLGRNESNVDYFDQIAPALPILETLRVVQAAQRTFKGELGPRFDQAVEFSQDHATGRYGRELRAQFIVRDRPARLAHLARRSEAQPAPCAPSRLSK
jgi:hypothetical protein